MLSVRQQTWYNLRGTLRFDLHYIVELVLTWKVRRSTYYVVEAPVRWRGICRHTIPQTVSSLRIIFRKKWMKFLVKYHICTRRWRMSSVCSVAISCACKQTHSTFRHRRSTLFSINVSLNLQFHFQLRLFRFYNIYL